jgi:predicted transglutaminase-like protease
LVQVQQLLPAVLVAVSVLTQFLDQPPHMVVVVVVYIRLQMIQDLVVDQVVVVVPMVLLLLEVQHLHSVKVMLVVVVSARSPVMLVLQVAAVEPAQSVLMVAILCLLLVMVELEFCGLMDIIIQGVVVAETGQQLSVPAMVD